MHTNTSNSQFRKVLASILPFIGTAVYNKMRQVVQASQRTVQRLQLDIHNLPSEKCAPEKVLTFHHHADIVHTEPLDSRDYDNRMPQHLTLLSGATTSRDLMYYYRSRTIENIVRECNQWLIDRANDFKKSQPNWY
jgi:hypothetical protein